MRRRLAAVAGFTMLLSALVPAGTASAATSSTHCTSSKTSPYISNSWYPATASGSSNCRLNQSSPRNNPAVRTLQYHLNWCYGENLLVDGNFGSYTAAAVRRMQAREGLVVDGWYGNNTRDRMQTASLGMGTGRTYCGYGYAPRS